MRSQLLGTTVDVSPALRDSVLAGGFTCIVSLAVTGSLAVTLLGLLGGGFLGISLHLMPPEPEPGDSRLGRTAIRAITGGIAGAGVGGFFRWLFQWAHESKGSVVTGGIIGLVAGAIWYTLWALWETRASRGPSGATRSG